MVGPPPPFHTFSEIPALLHIDHTLCYTRQKGGFCITDNSITNLIQILLVARIVVPVIYATKRICQDLYVVLEGVPKTTFLSGEAGITRISQSGFVIDLLLWYFYNLSTQRVFCLSGKDL